VMLVRLRLAARFSAQSVSAALRVCETFIKAPPLSSTKESAPRPFIYISAEDIFQPLIPQRYISTKREAERGIEEMMLGKPDFRGVYIRPSMKALHFP
jgi:hypothetical protein